MAEIILNSVAFEKGEKQMKKLLRLYAVAVLVSAAAAQAGLVVPDSIIDELGLAVYKQGTIKTLSGPGDYDWWYGCSPTSAGMLIGYYDVMGYSNLVPGGNAENSTYGTGPYLANDAIASSGHISDFYSGLSPSDGYGLSGDDAAEPWHSFNCLADFMGTSQDAYGNSNGQTSFWFYSDNSPLTASDLYSYGPDYYNSDGMYGIGEYIDYAGYDTTILYSQYIYGYNEISAGFTYEQYKAEIDAGRGVLIHVEGHSMYGYGYNSATNSVLLHDTWSSGQHSMVWGGSYSGLQQFGVTVLTIVPEPTTACLLAIGSLALIRKKK